MRELLTLLRRIADATERTATATERHLELQTKRSRGITAEHLLKQLQDNAKRSEQHIIALGKADAQKLATLVDYGQRKTAYRH